MEIKLTAYLREKGEKLGPDFVPAVIYGKNVENKSLKVKKNELEKTFRSAGESNLISLEIGDEISKVLVKDTQHDVLKGFFTHVDFYQVNMKEKVNAEIPLHFVGESKAIKELGGTLIKDLHSLEIECLPGDLVDHIDIDISVLKTFEDVVRVNDIILPKGMTLINHTNETIVAVHEPKAEVEVEVEAVAPVATSEVDAPTGGEVKKEEKKENKK